MHNNTLFPTVLENGKPMSESLKDLMSGEGFHISRNVFIFLQLKEEREKQTALAFYFFFLYLKRGGERTCILIMLCM